MKPASPRILSVLVVLGAALAIRAANIGLSGRVVHPNGKGKAGVALSIQVGTDLYRDTTDSNGNWSLRQTTGIAPSLSRTTAARKLPAAHLMVQHGRLQLSFDGHDFFGKPVAEGPPKIAEPAGAARSAVMVVTTAPYALTYTYGTRTFLRDTVSDLFRAGIVRVFDTSWNGSIVYGYMTDARDKQTYRIYKDNNRIWMAQNLNLVTDNSWPVAWDTTGWKFGRLYTWAAAQGLPDSCDTVLCPTPGIEFRGNCPFGWHLPSEAEWKTILSKGSSTSATRLKAIDFVTYNNEGRTDPRGFHAEPAGKMVQGTYKADGAHWWMGVPGQQGLWADAVDLSILESHEADWPIDTKTEGHSVRCMEDTLGVDIRDTAIEVGKELKLHANAKGTAGAPIRSIRWVYSSSRGDLKGDVLAGNDTTIVVSDTNSYYWIATLYAADSVAKVRTTDTARIEVAWYLTDSRDQQRYRIVKIGTQTWMMQNLNFKTSRSRTVATDPDGAKYGAVYTWADALGMDDSCDTKVCSTLVNSPVRGVCPEGWHVPDYDEWATLITHVGGANLYAPYLKSRDGGWRDYRGTDPFGFRALNGASEWWSTQEGKPGYPNDIYALARGVNDAGYEIGYDYIRKTDPGFLRCLRN